MKLKKKQKLNKKKHKCHRILKNSKKKIKKMNSNKNKKMMNKRKSMK